MSRVKFLRVENFTVFRDTKLEFVDINIIIGENRTGKTHLLKIPYTTLFVTKHPEGLHPEEKKPASARNTAKRRSVKQTTNGPAKSALEPKLGGKLKRVFGTKENVGRLVRRRQGRNRCTVEVNMENDQETIAFSFATNSSSKVDITTLPVSWHEGAPVFLPAHELLSTYRGFTWLCDKYDTDFEETWNDTSRLLGAPPRRGRRAGNVAGLAKSLESKLAGKIVLKNNLFHLQGKDGMMEIQLVAEGLRKIGTLSHIINTGQMDGNDYMFWDEPESNLNPRLIRTIAETIYAISKLGTQVFLATHSVFLLKEIEICRRKDENGRKLRYFALEKKPDGTIVHPADSIYDVEPWVALDEAIEQSQRLMDAR